MEDTILHFTTDECELCVWLIELESRQQALDVVNSNALPVEKADKLFNGLLSLGFLRTLFILQSSNPQATLHLNDVAMKTLSVLIRTTELRNFSDRLLNLYMDNAVNLLRKFENETTSVANVSAKPS